MDNLLNNPDDYEYYSKIDKAFDVFQLEILKQNMNSDLLKTEVEESSKLVKERLRRIEASKRKDKIKNLLGN